MNLSSKERSMVLQIRMEILPINLETGRYRNIPVEKRVCFNCTDTIENEMHFLLQCPVYDDYRNVLLNNVNDVQFEYMNDFSKISFLCTYFPRQLAKYVCHAFEKRQQIVYSDN